MKTAYKPNVVSPFQTLGGKYGSQNKRHPADEEVLRNTGVVNFTATVEVDTQMLNLLKNPNVIAFLCTLKQGELVLGQGRGISIFSETNKYIARTVKFAASASILDAVAKGIKLDSLQSSVVKKPTTSLPVHVKGPQEGVEGSDVMSEKQRSYLLKLIESNIEDEDERSKLESELKTYSRSQASLAIQALVNH